MTRALLVQAARAELGNEDPSAYWLEVLNPPQARPVDAKGKPLSWCGAFVLYLLRLVLGWRFHWIPGKGFVGPAKLRTTTRPQPGDVAYRNRGQHYALVIDAGEGWVSTIDGNSTEIVNGVRKYGRVVLHERTPKGEWTAFYSIGL